MLRGKFELNYEQVYLDAKSRAAEDQMEDELYSFAKLLQDHYEFKLFLEDPRIAAEYKKKRLKQICPEGISNNFLSIVFMLIDHGREELVESLSKNFRRRLFLDKGILCGEVSSVFPPSQNQKQNLQKVMENLKGCPVRLRYNIDSELLAGFTISLINGEVWDVSLMHKLEDFRAAVLA